MLFMDPLSIQMDVTDTEPNLKIPHELQAGIPVLLYELIKKEFH
jgi:hypothetical protein